MSTDLPATGPGRRPAAGARSRRDRLPGRRCRRAPCPRCWTLCDGEGTSTSRSTGGDADTGSPTCCPALGRALGRPVDGLWHGIDAAPRRPPLTAPAARSRRRPRRGPDRRPDGRRAAGQRPRTARRRRSGRRPHLPARPGAPRPRPRQRRAVRLDDPDVSRRHVAVHVGGGAVTVGRPRDRPTAAGSTTTTSAPTPATWPAGAVLRLGASALTVAGPVRHAVRRWSRRRAADGGCAPTPRLAAPRAEVEVRFPRPPAAAPPRGSPGWRSPSPRSAACSWRGCSTHRPSCSSPCSARSSRSGTWLVGAVDRPPQRPAGRGRARAGRLRPPRRRLAAAVRADVRAAETAHPDLATLTTAARRRTSLLWSRTGTGADALVVRLGTGPGPTRVTRVDGDGARVHETAPHLPVVVDLRGAGGLAVVGPRERALGVAPRRRRPALRRCTPPARSTCSSLTAARPARRLGVDPLAAAPRPPARCTSLPGRTRTTSRSTAWLTALVGRGDGRGGPRPAPEPRPARAAGGRRRPTAGPAARRRALRGARDVGVLTLTLGRQPPTTCRSDVDAAPAAHRGDRRRRRCSAGRARPTGMRVDRRPAAARRSRPRSPATWPGCAGGHRRRPAPARSACSTWPPARGPATTRTPATGSLVAGPGPPRGRRWAGRRTARWSSTCAVRARTRWSPAPPARASPSCCRP